MGLVKGYRYACRHNHCLPPRPGGMRRHVSKAQAMIEKTRTKFLREGRFNAEVDVELIEDDHEWSPDLSVADVRKLDQVSRAL